MSPLILLALVVTVESGCGGISDTEIAGFLNEHNTLRRNISEDKFTAKGTPMPAASTPIPALTWDCALEQSAQTWAKGCDYKQHSVRSGDIGENIYSMWASNGISLTGKGAEASKSWAKEFQDYGWKNINLTSEVLKTGIGHATQMAAARSTKIGCGMQKCGSGTVAVVVCQYSLHGNMLNINTYPPKL